MANLSLKHIYKVYPNGAKAVNDFEENLDEALVSDASVMRKNLINLKLKINEKVVAVDFLS